MDAEIASSSRAASILAAAPAELENQRLLGALAVVKSRVTFA